MLKTRVLNRAIRLRAAHPHLRVVGITGSVGKTTLKEMLSHILKDLGAEATPDRVNTEMGVAQWLTKILTNEPIDSTRILIVEMGAYRRGEIALLCRIAQPQYGAITYVGDQHLSLFGSHEAIIEAKGELFVSLPPEGKAFGNSDNDAFNALRKKCACPVITVGTGQQVDVLGTDIEETSDGIRFKVLGTHVSVPIQGTHNVTGALLAIAVAQEMGMTLHDIAKRLQSFQPKQKTFERKTLGKVTVLDDTYNSSPDSVRAAIEWAKKQPHTKKILVLEGIIELGDAEARIHTDIAHLASDIFTVAYVAHSRHLPYFRDGGFGSRVSVITETPIVDDGSLIVLSGRLSEKVIKRFLP
jgi:UDP-N-acetylmuramoyl-tripeptide--D-alanyl-D-alanine ligase